MESLRKSVILGQACRRYISQSAVQRSSKLKESQKLFGTEDGTPIYIKAGFKDKFLYQGTWLLTAIGVAMMGETLYKLSYPKKED